MQVSLDFSYHKEATLYEFIVLQQLGSTFLLSSKRVGQVLD